MKKKKRLFVFIGILFIAAIGVFLGYILVNNNNSYTILEKKWIEDNRNKVIDISILNDIPAINYNGNGLLFSFFEDFEKDMGLKFNKSAYKIKDNVSSNYVFQVVDQKKDNDILIMKDNFVLITKNVNFYDNIQDIYDLKIGIMDSDLSLFSEILDNNILESFESYDNLMEDLVKEDTELDGIIILKSFAMKFLIDNNLKISYQFFNQTKDFVITLNGDETLNSIIRKYYANWFSKSFNDEYNESLLNHYYEFKNIKDSERTDIRSKKYVYGFVENGIFDLLNGSKLRGINNLVLKNFSDFSGVAISFKRYNNIKDLVESFNNSTIDILLNTSNTTDFSNNGLVTFDGIGSKLAVVSSYNNNVIIDSMNSLTGEEIAIVDGSFLESYLENYNVNIHKYQNMKDLLNHISDDELLIIDLDNYNYYKNSSLIDYKIDYVIDEQVNYKYIINGNEKNLADLFDFYINYISSTQIISENYNNIAYNVIDYFFILVVVIILLFVALLLISINKIKKYLVQRRKHKKINLSKEDKLKFIDQLTSLKNRAYLNSKIDSWDNSEIYPQSIVIVDLNNISAINDNYGREEGDRVIVEAASILINSQLPNSEIIRTDGNEFLIYLVGYNEKNVISYLRNISRSMKKLTHGFGAATGYSMINDGIKTIDDAVNEATLDMKNNKEDIDY